MAKVHKITTYLIDPDDLYSSKELENLLSFNDGWIKHTEVHSSDSFEWYDDIPLNRVDCKKEEIEKYLEYKRVPCDSYKTRVRKEPRYNVITGEITHYVTVEETYCTGTKECEVCDCGGDKKQCSFYTYKDGKLN